MASWNNSALKRVQSGMERNRIDDNRSLSRTPGKFQRTTINNDKLSLQLFQLLNKKMKQQKLKHEKYYRKIKQSLAVINSRKGKQHRPISNEFKRQILDTEIQLRKQVQQKNNQIRQLQSQCQKLGLYKNEIKELKDKIMNKDEQFKKMAFLKDSLIEKLNQEISGSTETITQLQEIVQRYMERQRKKQRTEDSDHGLAQPSNIEIQIEKLRLENIRIKFEKQKIEKQLGYLRIEKVEYAKQLEKVSMQSETNRKQGKKAHQLQQKVSDVQRELIQVKKKNIQLSESLTSQQCKNKQMAKQISKRDITITKLQEIQKKLKLKIEESQKQFIHLLTDSKVEQLQNNISAKNKEINDLKTNISQLKELGRKKSEQISELKSSYTPIYLGEDDQQESFEIKNQNFADSFGKQQEQHILQAELEIIKCKYNLLESMYVALKTDRDRVGKNNLVSVIVQTEEQKGAMGLQIEAEGDEQHMRKSLSNISQRSLKKNLSGYSLFRQARKDGKLDLSIAGDSTIHNKYSDLNSPASAYNFVNLFQQSELESKIKQFSFNNSILSKVNNSRFITTPSSKVSLIFQYACYLELYFSPRFLNTALEELIMGQQMQVKNLSRSDMICQFIDDGQTSPLNNSSFLSSSISSSKPRSSNKMYIANQFSMNSIEKPESGKVKIVKLKLCSCTYTQTIFYSAKSIKKIEMREKMKEMDKNFRQIKQYFSSDRKPRDERTNPEMTEKLKEIRNNDVAIYLVKILEQNEAMKKCLNEMIKSEEIFTKKNNEICFQAYPYDQEDNQKTERQHSSAVSEAAENPPERIPKQNCHIM